MELSNILPLEKWLGLEKDIFEMSGLASNVFNVDGIRITDFKVWVNRLCPAIKADDSGQSFICAVAHMNIAGMAKENKGAFIGECDAGLLKLVVPIFVNGEFLGAVGACGLLLDDSEVDSFMINRTIGMDYEKIEGLSHDIKRITSEEAEALGKYIAGRIGKIVSDFEKHGV
ncbi:MAG: PocR ligand-binding domain-containing protein [Nitrospirae bacterium]|nr:PocR ligand-binding domain-containing protein [Nitrospirota bacterium]